LVEGGGGPDGTHTRTSPPPGRAKVNIAKSFAQHAATMFFPHFVGDACS
jgi:hypothetical protein